MSHDSLERVCARTVCACAGLLLLVAGTNQLKREQAWGQAHGYGN